MLQTGDLAPALDVFDGTKPILIVFFKVNCPTCQLTLPFLNRLEAGLRVVGISQNSQRHTNEFRDALRLDYPLVLDTKGYPASNAYGIRNVPSMFLVGLDGRIEWSQAGFSKQGLAAVAERFGIEMFLASERVPESKPG